MANSPPPRTRLVFLLPLMIIVLSTIATDAQTRPPHMNYNMKRTYIVQMDNSAMPTSLFTSHADWYTSKIQSVVATAAVKTSQQQEAVTDDHAKQRILYTYHHSFHGLAAQLTDDEVDILQQQDGVITVFPENIYQLHTTRSPLFLGLLQENEDAHPSSSTSSNSVLGVRESDHDVVVGILDTGIWPESPSFNDSGILSPVPRRWRGKCEAGKGFSPRQHCNRKIVGARIFYRGYEAAAGEIDEGREHKSPRDADGHGTHTAATVAGAPVPGANLLGYASGTARGMAPGARVAAYKVCWAGGCFSSDILSAVDAAVEDGVDVLSISLGGGVSSYYRDSLSVATFGAMEKGVLVSCSAGNGGPDPASLTNVAPWVVTVGASTMDRDFPAAVHLGTGEIITGSSIYRGRQNLSPNRQYPLVYLGGANSSSPDPSSLCLEGTLNPKMVRGKIVICDRGISPRVQKGQVVKEAGGVGMILANTAENGEELVADCHLIPALAVGQKEGELIKRYASLKGKSSSATATLRFMGTRTGVQPSPVVAAFSSRGPSILTTEIMKPDVIAPGVNILAAWTGAMGPSGLEYDTRRVGFNVISGTSMSAPHVSGVAALIRARHPDWSPAAIKSALMTTAYINGRGGRRPIIDAATGELSGPFQHGSGHINPLKAVDPGLVYDISVQDYFDFLCTQDLTPLQLRVFSKSTNRTCSSGRIKKTASPGDLNYPAISFVFSSSNINHNSSSLTVRRTVTNVGRPLSTYRVSVSSGFKAVSVVVEPRILKFTRKGQSLGFTVRVTSLVGERQTEPEFGHLVWKDGIHRVRTPILVTREIPISPSSSLIADAIKT